MLIGIIIGFLAGYLLGFFITVIIFADRAERHESERAFNEYLKRKEEEHVNKNS